MTRSLSIALSLGILFQFVACASKVHQHDDDSALAGRAPASAGSASQSEGGAPSAGETSTAGETSNGGGHGGSAQTESSAGEGGVGNDAGGTSTNPQAGGTAGTGMMTEQPLVSCEPFTTIPVGSYVVEADYWNETQCPGTQCLSIDTSTGAFSVTQGPTCGNTVASYPNVLYGSSFGTVSPGSALPKALSDLSSVTSSWSFDVGGTSADQYDVAYDIWFCPTDACDSGGFAGGLELMIWLNYRNTTGWEQDLGSVSLAGHEWEVWSATAGGGANSWTYLAYLIQPSMVNSVSDFDILAFIDDAVSRGLLPSTSYLYAIQAGNELRSGGVPYTNQTFSVAIQ